MRWPFTHPARNGSESSEAAGPVPARTAPPASHLGEAARFAALLREAAKSGPAQAWTFPLLLLFVLPLLLPAAGCPGGGGVESDAGGSDADAGPVADGSLPDSGPRSLTIDPTWAWQGSDQVVSIQGRGTRFDDDTEVALPGAEGIELLDLEVESATSLRATLRVTHRADPRAYQVAVSDLLGTLYVPFSVREDPTHPSMVLDPHSLVRGESAQVQALCQNTHLDADQTHVSVSPSGAGLSAALLSVVTTTEARLELSAAADTPPGLYQVWLQTGPEVVSGQVYVVRSADEVTFEVEPGSIRQGDEAWFELTGPDIALDSTSRLEIDPDAGQGGSGISLQGFDVLDAGRARFRLTASPDATPGSLRLLLVTDSTGQRASGWVQVTEAPPAVSLAPDSAAQGWRSLAAEAHLSFARFSDPPGLVPATGCSVQVHDLELADDQTLRFLVDVPLDEPLGDCPLFFSTDRGPVAGTLEIRSGLTDLPVPGEVDGSVETGQATWFRLHLEAGQVVRLRAIESQGSFLDPVLRLFGPDGNTTDPLAENDDESEAVYASLVVYRALQSGDYYLSVTDRLATNSGPFHLSAGIWAPEAGLEDSSLTGLPPGQPMDVRILRGELAPAGAAGSVDFYDLSPVLAGLDAAPWGKVAVRVLSWDVSPYAGSGTQTRLTAYDALGQELASAVGSDSADPQLYLNPDDLRFLTVENLLSDAQGRTGLYWLSVRPAVVINEVRHDEQGSWPGGFVELLGQPGLDLTGCVLTGRAWDGGQALDLFSLSLDGTAIGPAGYLVLCHDDLVSGCGPGDIRPELAVPDPAGLYSTIAISLRCGQTRVDTVCWRGADLPECEGGPVATGDEGVVGRGYGMDREDNAADFMEQAEPSPWGRNVTEVR